MQKKIIALAIAGLASTAAFAQSNVTIYGVADATFDSVKATKGSSASEQAAFVTRQRVTANSSYIGFKGVEDLGNGLKAVFQFENGINNDNSSAGSWNNRDSYVGLSGGFGTVVAGNLTGPTRAVGAKYDVNQGATGIGANAALLGKLGTIAGDSGASAFDQRISNAVAYVSPTVAGFTGVIGYSTGLSSAAIAGTAAAVIGTNREATGAGDVQFNTARTLGLGYANGPISVDYAYTRVGLKDAQNDLQDHRLGFLFSQGWGSVGLLAERTSLQATTGNLTQNVFYVPVKVNVGKGRVIGQFGHAGNVKNTVASEGANHYVLGYEHDLSKRTTLKLVYSQINNKEGSNYDYLYGAGNANSTATNTSGVANDANVKGISLGLRHAF
uniref:Porin, Gram-negative type n=1 Tax=Dechloromonas aromatica (strain RCB) TaxID=159087 RepID=Q47AC8_DECAR